MISNKKMRSIIATMRTRATAELSRLVSNLGWNKLLISPGCHEEPKDVVEELRHILYMCNEMEAMLIQKRLLKLHRWLGWAQKSLQTCGVMSLEEMKRLNMPDKPAPDVGVVVPIPIKVEYHTVDNLGVAIIAGSAMSKTQGLTPEETRHAVKEGVEHGLLHALYQLAEEEPTCSFPSSS